MLVAGGAVGGNRSAVSARRGWRRTALLLPPLGKRLEEGEAGSWVGCCGEGDGGSEEKTKSDQQAGRLAVGSLLGKRENENGPGGAGSVEGEKKNENKQGGEGAGLCFDGSRILFKGKQNVGAVVTGKRVGDGAGNGFGEQS